MLGRATAFTCSFEILMTRSLKVARASLICADGELGVIDETLLDRLLPGGARAGEAIFEPSHLGREQGIALGLGWRAPVSGATAEPIGSTIDRDHSSEYWRIPSRCTCSSAHPRDDAGSEAYRDMKA